MPRDWGEGVIGGPARQGDAASLASLPCEAGELSAARRMTEGGAAERRSLSHAR